MNQTTTPGELTERQVEVLEAICRLSRENGVPPTFRELQERLGISSPNGIYGHLVPLAKKGWIVHGRQEHSSFKVKSRGVRLLVAPPGWVLLPNGSLLTVAEADSWSAQWRAERWAKRQAEVRTHVQG